MSEKRIESLSEIRMNEWEIKRYIKTLDPRSCILYDDLVIGYYPDFGKEYRSEDAIRDGASIYDLEAIEMVSLICKVLVKEFVNDAWVVFWYELGYCYDEDCHGIDHNKDGLFGMEIYAEVNEISCRLFLAKNDYGAIIMHNTSRRI